MSLSEPATKKAKLQYDNDSIIKILDSYSSKIRESSAPLKMVLNEDLFNPVPLIKVYAGHIKDPSLISKTVLLLNERIPLKELQHLKRVKKRDIILCPLHFLNGTSSIQEYLENHVHELQNVFEYFKEVDVPYLPPKVLSQYKEANKIWSVNFHPNKYLESIASNSIFKENQLAFHKLLMTMVFDVAKWYVMHYNIQVNDDDVLKNINAAVIFDPVANLVVAADFDNRSRHPMQHATMLAIDRVAKTQNGGAWVSEEEDIQPNRQFSGVNKDLCLYLCEKYPEVTFGARPFKCKEEKTDRCKQEKTCKQEKSDTDNVSDGPYLCTGYYIYLLREPCVMCSMALIHARMSRTFFCFDSKKHGAVMSQTKLHLNPSLNHRYEVFTGFL